MKNSTTKFYFNSREIMPHSMRSLIFSLTTDVSIAAGFHSELENQMFGLLDGVCYGDNMELLKELKGELNFRVYQTLEMIFDIAKTWEAKQISEDECHYLNCM